MSAFHELHTLIMPFLAYQIKARDQSSMNPADRRFPWAVSAASLNLVGLVALCVRLSARQSDSGLMRASAESSPGWPSTVGLRGGEAGLSSSSGYNCHLRTSPIPRVRLRSIETGPHKGRHKTRRNRPLGQSITDPPPSGCKPDDYRLRLLLGTLIVPWNVLQMR
jgi:hypothetical protein